MRARAVILAVCMVCMPGRCLYGQAGATAIIERAIEAQGGPTQVAKLRTTRIKVEGRIDLGPDQKDLPFALEDTRQAPRRYKTVLRVQVTRVAAHSLTVVLDGDKGWAQAGDRVVDLRGADLAEVQDQRRGEDLDRLGFLKDKSRVLTLLPDTTVRGQPAVGVLVKARGQRDVKLYFDRSSGLLLKRERRIVGPAGREVLQETFFSDYQEQDGLKHYRKIAVLHDGDRFIEGTVSELEFFDKLDAKVFARP